MSSTTTESADVDRLMMSGRSFDRFVNFTDAVVAIAITLLVLPLLDVPGPQADETVWTVLSNNTGPILAFGLAFGLVAQNWLIHNRIVNMMRGYNGPVFWLNIGWIAAIALMPWTAAMYGASESVVEGGEGFGGTGMLFFSVLAALSAFMLAVSAYVDRRRFLLEPERLAEWDRLAGIGRWRMVAIILALLACGVTSMYIPGLGAYLPLLVFPLLHILIVIVERRRTEPAAGQWEGANPVG